ncbi:MAG: cadherin-like beta sandwich domain-containing protein, partial [Oscillospiraceae bacterium]
MRQYCISTICADRDGTLYYKNDSCYVMAVETNNAYAEDIKITADDGTEATWNTAFDQKNTEYEVKVPAAASSITLNLTLPDDATAEVNGTAYTDGMRVELTGESTSLEVAVKVGEQTKTYTIDVKKISTDSTLNSLKVSTSNTPGSNKLEISPEFNSDVTNYTAEATDVAYSSFWRVWVDATVEDSTIEVIPVENVEKVNDSTISSRGYVGVYAEDGNKTCKV